MTFFEDQFLMYSKFFSLKIVNRKITEIIEDLKIKFEALKEHSESILAETNLDMDISLNSSLFSMNKSRKDEERLGCIYKLLKI